MDLQSKLNVSLGDKHLFELAVSIDKKKKEPFMYLFSREKDPKKTRLARFKKALFSKIEECTNSCTHLRLLPLDRQHSVCHSISS